MPKPVSGARGEGGVLRGPPGALGAARARAPDGAVTARCRGAGFCRGPAASALEGLSRSPRHGPSFPHRDGAFRVDHPRKFSAVRGGSCGHPPVRTGAPEPNKRLLQAGGITRAACLRRYMRPPERRWSCEGRPGAGPLAGRRRLGWAGGAPRLPSAAPRRSPAPPPRGEGEGASGAVLEGSNGGLLRLLQYSRARSIQTSRATLKRRAFITLPLNKR